MATLINSALGFYVDHFDDAEVLRNFWPGETPKGISHQDWHKARQVLRSTVDRAVESLLETIAEVGLQPQAENAQLILEEDDMASRREKHWGTQLPISEKGGKGALMAVGVAIDKLGAEPPGLIMFLDYPLRRQTSRRKGAQYLRDRGLCVESAEDAERGWTGQLIVARHAVTSSSTEEECVAWADKSVRPFLTEHWMPLTAEPRRSRTRTEGAELNGNG